jgi:hypothetical protein
MAALLHWRLAQRVSRRAPEREASGAGWADRTPAIPGPVGDYARQLAAEQAADDERRAEQAQAAERQREEELAPSPERSGPGIDLEMEPWPVGEGDERGAGHKHHVPEWLR